MTLAVVRARLRLRAGEKISESCGTGNLVVPRWDLNLVLGALDLADGIMPPGVLEKARALRTAVRELSYHNGMIESSRIDRGNAKDDTIVSAQRWTARTIDAAVALVDAVMAYEITGDRGAPAGGSTSATHEEKHMGSLRDQVGQDQAAVNATVQKAVDRNVAARAELQASNEELQGIVGDLQTGDAATLNFVLAYMNPTTPNPEPIAPDVATPPPQVEPPVFTDISTPTITPDTTSGGSSDVAASLPVEEFPALVEENPPTPAADTTTTGAGSGDGGSGEAG